MPRPATTTLHAADHLLDQVLAEISEQLRGGEPIDVEAHCRKHPALADQLRAVLPTMQVLANLDTSGTPNDSSDSALRIPNSALETLGDFRILRELGRGGMGVVYEALQLSLDRRVALKVLPLAGLLSDTQLKRFKNEARAAALLDHPHIVSVYSVGCERGVHYYAMQLIEGQSLAEVIAELRDESQEAEERGQEPGNRGQRIPISILHPAKSQQPPRSAIETRPIAALSTEFSTNPKRFFRRVAELGIEAASALDHAHQSGVIHRDIKPANLLLDAAGKLFVTDFGLARLEADASVTATGDLVGTLRYMSPEQVGGSRTGLDHRTDIYSLGVTLYELATGVPAFAGQDRHDLVRRITESEPRPPRELRPQIPHDLATIILMAMEKVPADRYASASEMASDLRRYLDDQPIRARRPSLVACGRKWVRRHPSFVGAAILGLAVSLAAALLAAGVAQAEQGKAAEALSEKSSALQQAEQNLKLANHQRERARKNLVKAIDTVDRMYTSFVKNWLAADAGTSTVQFSYVIDALEFYQELIADLEGDPAERRLLGVAFERIGDIEHFLQDYSAAAEAWQLAVNMSETQLALDPKDVTHLEDLIRRYAGLGASLEKLGRVNEADEAYRTGLDHVQNMSRDVAQEPIYQLELARYHILRAALLSRQNRPTDGEPVVLAARELLLALPPTLPGPNRYLLDLESARALARIHWQQDRLPEARKLTGGALNDCQRLRLKEFSDLRPLLLAEVELTALDGDLALAAGEYETAVAALQRALEFKRQSLRAQLDPALFQNKAGLSIVTAWDGQYEPGAFIEYNQIALRLATALARLGRPYEAECLLGDCLISSGVIDDIEHVLDSGVAQANSAALTAQLLAESRPDDARKLLAQAVDEWGRILGEFPRAGEYTSGVHGLQGDLSWFRATFPDEILVPQPPVPDDQREYGRNAGEDTASMEHAAGLLRFRGGDYAGSLTRFNKAATMRTSGREFDWLYLAMAHAKIGEHDRAQEWLAKANNLIESVDTSNSELISLHKQAEAVVNHRTSE